MQPRRPEMHDVERDVPVDPGAPRQAAQPARRVRAADPDLAAGPQQAADVGQRRARRQEMLQHVGQHHHVVGGRWPEVGDVLAMHGEAGRARHRGRRGVGLQPFGEKAVGAIEGEAAALVAADIEQPAATRAAMKRDVAVERQPQPVEAGRMQQAAQAEIGPPGRAGEVVVVAVELDQGRLARARQRLLEAAAGAAGDGEAAGNAEAGVGDVIQHRRKRSAAHHAIGLERHVILFRRPSGRWVIARAPAALVTIPT